MSGLIPGRNGWFLIVLGAGVLYDVLASIALRHWLRDPAPRCTDPIVPITFFRPLKRGVPRLREKLEALVASSLAGDQILFGVDPDTEEEALCAEVQRAFPQRDIAVVRCAPGAAVNPKISKVVQMEAPARHAAWLLSDSEVIFDPEFVDAFRREWQAEAGAALTAAYRFANTVSGPQCCDALAVLLGLWPGLALVRRFGDVKFTLGACTLVRRDGLAEVGGWRAFGDMLAEDHQLGAALAKAGQRIRLSRQIATLDSDAMSWTDYWRHQRRVAVTYRAASPVGFAGMVITQGLVWCLVACLIWPPESSVLIVFSGAVLIRTWRLQGMAGALKFHFPWPWIWMGLPPSSVMETVCWVLSWLSSRVWWSGRWWRVGIRGALSPVPSRFKVP
ncbi:MAG: glycosyltransferase [Chthoniobacter sp.]|uniref:glycosyltransferase n=1 Tax=Chthoniobacter sp. TaxID=2510640 RepID=UPI0032A2852F